MNCLKRADKIVGSRDKQYGDPVKNCQEIAQISTILLKKKIEPLDIVIIMKVLKMVRESNSHNPDNLIDEAGYLLIQEKIHERD